VKEMGGLMRALRGSKWKEVGGTLVHEQRRGRKGACPVGCPVGWGLAGGGEGGYDRWARARENGKEEKKTEINSENFL
jgi:hypothetical protein